jgi:RES domain-containing protein
MTPLPLFGPGSPLVAWRLDARQHAGTWDSGIGAELMGGRWNPKSVRAVYCSLDPATTILESAVHRGFGVLDTQPFILTSLTIPDTSDVKVVAHVDVPNPAWLHNGIPSAGQQQFGANLLVLHPFVIFPSVVSKFSWNLVFRPGLAAGKYTMLAQDRLVLDTRLNVPTP